MIILTRLGGHEVAVNPDLIERAESTPDTLLTMVDGHKIMVVEPLVEVVELVRTWRATVVAEAHDLCRDRAAARAVSRHPSLFKTSNRATSEGVDEAMGECASLDASLASVLRMPQRGE
ncbi:MAG: flagellar FlbD family protein [Kineosporiaceae bacterium]|nr:flagellar FlbD family protein [Kineosporiaceae bacterium]MBK7622134.1 flagellar FlbD family protein [Kineosporiaceae bacterium]MBK8074445.1 flagellar FlbD family protein [Kineosporiaceae bacterium]